MSIQEDHIQPQHPQTLWGQYPPSNSGYQWTCNLCKSIFGTLEQRERHQHECPGRNLPSPQNPWSSTVPNRQPVPLYGGVDVPHNPYPPVAQPQMSQMQDLNTAMRPQLPPTKYQQAVTPATYQHNTIEPYQHTSARRVQLHWMKESPTLDLQVTYIDEVNGGIELRWNPNSEIFEGAAELSLGQHSGCLTLTSSDTILLIVPFFVEQGGPAPQKIMISTGRRVVSSQSVTAVETERERGTGEKIRALQENINRLTADLDNRNNELAQQKQENIKYKLENDNLTQQVELLHKDMVLLRTEKPVPSIPVEIEALHKQIQSWEEKHGKLEKEVINFKEEKNAANGYSDYLYQQKQLFESQLQGVKERFEESETLIAQLRASLQEFTKDDNAPPPLPTRCKPALREDADFQTDY